MTKSCYRYRAHVISFFVKFPEAWKKYYRLAEGDERARSKYRSLDRFSD